MAVSASLSPRRAALALAIAGLIAGVAAQADQLTMPATESSATPAATAAPVAHPERGARMTSVEQHFGAPSTRYPAVGQPPITRWDYPNMVVYFEFDRVIHTVLVAPAG